MNTYTSFVLNVSDDKLTHLHIRMESVSVAFFVIPCELAIISIISLQQKLTAKYV